jgi:hypothetical protein
MLRVWLQSESLLQDILPLTLLRSLMSCIIRLYVFTIFHEYESAISPLLLCSLTSRNYLPLKGRTRVRLVLSFKISIFKFLQHSLLTFLSFGIITRPTLITIKIENNP